MPFLLWVIWLWWHGERRLFFSLRVLNHSYLFLSFSLICPQGVSPPSIYICNLSPEVILLKFCLSVPIHNQTLPCLQCCKRPSYSLCFVLSHSKLTFCFQGYVICVYQGSLLSPSLKPPLKLTAFLLEFICPLLAGKWKVMVSLSPSNVMILRSSVCSPDCFYVVPFGKPPVL